MKTGFIVLAALLVSSSVWAENQGQLSVGGYGASNGQSGLSLQGKLSFHNNRTPFDSSDNTSMRMAIGADLPAASGDRKGAIYLVGDVSMLTFPKQDAKADSLVYFFPVGLKTKIDRRLNAGVVGLSAAVGGLQGEYLLSEGLIGCVNARMFEMTVGGVQIQDAKGHVLLEPVALEGCLKAKLGEKAGSLRLGLKVSEGVLPGGSGRVAPTVSSAAVSLSYQKKFKDFSLGAGLESSVGHSHSSSNADPAVIVEDTVKINRATVDLAF